MFVTPMPSTVDVLLNIAKFLEVDTDPSKLHVTVMYSEAVPGTSTPNPNVLHTAVLEKVETFEGHDGKIYLTAALTAPSLEDLHDSWTKAGAVHSYPKFHPHVTLWANVKVTPELKTKIARVNATLKASPPLCFLSGETATDLKSD